MHGHGIRQHTRTARAAGLAGHVLDLLQPLQPALDLVESGQDLLDTIREQDRQLKLLNLIVGNFVPPEEKRKIERRCRFAACLPATPSNTCQHSVHRLSARNTQWVVLPSLAGTHPVV